MGTEPLLAPAHLGGKLPLPPRGAFQHSKKVAPKEEDGDGKWRSEKQHQVLGSPRIDTKICEPIGQHGKGKHEDL